METIEKQKEVLNDLIRINHDRIEGYEKAATESEKHPELVSLFRSYANESRRYANELKLHFGGDDDIDTTASGKVYRVWMDLRTAFDDSKKSLLDLCEFGEDAALKTYDAALDKTSELSIEAAQVVRAQRTAIKAAHDRIKTLRESAGK